MTGWPIPRGVRRFWRVASECNITGLSSMIAYSMLLGIVPIALLGLFVAGQVLSSHAVEHSVLTDLQEVFPGTAEHTLDSLLDEVQGSTTSTGVLALIASLWLGSSFWGALDTAFGRIYARPSRRWLEQKRFGIAMLIVVLVFMVATVAVPTAQSLLRAGVDRLPFDLAHVGAVVYAGSLVLSLAVLFACLVVIYSRVPNLHVPWRAVWPGALGATVAIGVVDYAFPAYLTNISTIARFGTTIVFVLIMLGWFYVLALIILGGAIVNALRFPGRSWPGPGPSEAEPGRRAAAGPDRAPADPSQSAAAEPVPLPAPSGHAAAAEPGPLPAPSGHPAAAEPGPLPAPSDLRVRAESDSRPG